MFLWLVIDYICRFPHTWSLCGKYGTVEMPVGFFVCGCVCFCKCNPHPRGLSEMPMTSYDSIWRRWLCVWLVCLQSEKKSFSGQLNVASVCVWMLSTGLECVFISTHGSTYCRVKMTFCQMQPRKPAGLRATVWHRARGWYLVALFVCFCEHFSGKSETLLIPSCRLRNAVHMFFHRVVDFLYYRRRLSVVVTLLHRALFL